MHRHIIINEPDNLVDQKRLFSRSAVALRPVFTQAPLYLCPTACKRRLQNFEDAWPPFLPRMFPHDALDFFGKRAPVDNVALFANPFCC